MILTAVGSNLGGLHQANQHADDQATMTMQELKTVVDQRDDEDDGRWRWEADAEVDAEMDRKQRQQQQQRQRQ